MVGPHDRVANQADRPETVDVQQHHCLGPVADVPVSTQHQAPTIQTEQWSVELPQFPHFNRVAVVAVVLQRQGWCTAMCGYRRPSDHEGNLGS